MGLVDIRTRSFVNARRLRWKKETGATAATTAPAAGTNGIDRGYTDHDSGRTIRFVDVADWQRDRRFDRRHRRGATERITECLSIRLDDLSPGREGCGWNAGGHGAVNGHAVSSATSADYDRNGRRLV